VLAAMAAATVDEFRNAAFVEKGTLPAGLSTDRRYGAADITLERYGSDEIRLAVSVDKDALLIVTNSFSPFWVAEIDGKRAPLFPAYHAFWGLALPAGATSVVFRFEPPYR
jgi:hypothetical protein